MVDVLVNLVFLWVTIELLKSAKTKQAKQLNPSLRDYAGTVCCAVVGASILSISLLQMDDGPLKGIIPAIVSVIAIAVCIWTLFIYRNIKR